MDKKVRLIDANKLLKEKIKIYVPPEDPEETWCFGYDIEVVSVEDVKNAPTIEAEPVKHGQWERTPDGAARCTACKRKMNPSQYGYAFCSLCGAKMDRRNNK